MLSKQQKEVLDHFRRHGTRTLVNLQGIYTTHKGLKDCLKRLVALKLITMIRHGVFRYNARQNKD